MEIYKNIKDYYDETNIRNFKFEKDPFSKNAQSIGKIYHEVLLLMKFSHTKPQVKIINNNYYDSYYIEIKNRDDEENVNDQYEDNETDYINYEDFTAPQLFIGIKFNKEKLK